MAVRLARLSPASGRAFPPVRRRRARSSNLQDTFHRKGSRSPAASSERAHWSSPRPFTHLCGMQAFLPYKRRGLRRFRLRLTARGIPCGGRRDRARRRRRQHRRGPEAPASRGPFPQIPAFEVRCIRSGFVARPHRTAVGTPRSGASPGAAHRPSRCAASSGTDLWRPGGPLRYARDLVPARCRFRSPGTFPWGDIPLSSITLRSVPPSGERECPRPFAPQAAARTPPQRPVRGDGLDCQCIYETLP